MKTVDMHRVYWALLSAQRFSCGRYNLFTSQLWCRKAGKMLYKTLHMRLVHFIVSTEQQLQETTLWLQSMLLR